MKFPVLLTIALIAGSAGAATRQDAASPCVEATRQDAASPCATTLQDAPSRDGKHSGKSTNTVSRTVKITSDRASYLKKDAIVAFEGHVFVDDVEFKMHADEVSLFLDGTNSLKRLVAIGSVAVTNGTRYGSCAKATYNKAMSKVVLYSDPQKGVPARLVDAGKRQSELEGRKITYWIDTEQVEVDGSTVTVDAGGFGGKQGAKGFLGK